ALDVGLDLRLACRCRREALGRHVGDGRRAGRLVLGQAAHEPSEGRLVVRRSVAEDESSYPDPQVSVRAEEAARGGELPRLLVADHAAYGVGIADKGPV